MTASLAAFFDQPAEEPEPETTLAAFYAQPADEEDEAEVEEPLHAQPADGEDEAEVEEPLHVQADRDQAEHHAAMISTALADLGAQYGGTVTGLVVRIEGEPYSLLFEVGS